MTLFNDYRNGICIFDKLSFFTRIDVDIFKEDHNLDGCEEPLRVYLTCFQVLEENKDPRAGDILNQAYALVMERANLIEDEVLRASFLENVKASSEIIKAFENYKSY